jgi:hypothetical protein
MTLGRWLDERSAGVPPRLTTRLDEAVADVREVADADTTKVCIDAAEALLRDLLARSSAGRDVALDLLTVDALVTYAFEAGAAHPTTLRECAAVAAARFAAVAND